jgi:hypothetical protein
MRGGSSDQNQKQSKHAHTMTKSTKALIAGAAMAGLFTGSVQAASSVTKASGTSIEKAGKSATTLADDKADKHSCKGKNDCKGKGGCKTGDNGCKGKNSCKGKGGCATDGSHDKKAK